MDARHGCPPSRASIRREPVLPCAEAAPMLLRAPPTESFHTSRTPPRRWGELATEASMTKLPGLIACLSIVVSTGAARAGDALTSAGDILQIALPVAAAVCAQHQHRLASYAVGFAAQTAVAQSFKYGLGDAPLNQRPNGTSHGFPSGHTAAAFSGATDLSTHCAPGNVPLALSAVGAAALVGASRVHADEHDMVQVLAGAALGAFSTGLTVTRTPGGAWGLSYDFDF